MSQQQTPPPVDPKAVKPGRFWYVIAAIIIAAGIGGGITVFVFGLSSVAGSVPELDTEIATDTPTAVGLSKDQDWALYVEYPRDEAPVVECTAESEDGKATLSSSNTTFTFSSGGQTWHLAYEVSVDATGDYTFTCDSDSKVGGFAVGEAVDVGGFVGGIFGTVGGLVGIPCFSLVVGGVIILVVALRRSSSKKRLRTQPGAPGAW